MGSDRPSDTGSDEGWDDGSGQALEEMIEHADRALGTESFGTTADEQERGQPIDCRERALAPRGGPKGGGRP